MDQSPKITYCCAMKDGRHGLGCRYRYVLWVVLMINLSLFFLEMASSMYAQSLALLADSIDFFGDSVNYALTLLVLNQSLKIRAYAALFKGITMGVLGVGILSAAIYKAFAGGLPQAEIMSTIGVIAMAGNFISAYLLYQYRDGDSNRQSAWICSRNDSISNIIVVLAGGCVYIFGSQYPDLIVAVMMSVLAISGAVRILRAAKNELQSL